MSLLRPFILSVIVIVSSLLLYIHVPGRIQNVEDSPIALEQHGRRLANAPAATANLAKAKEQCEEVLSLIYNRYELGGSIGQNFLLATQNMESEAWEILKHKFAIRMLQDNTDNDYLMIFGGSSVTAAHDNYYNQSYPAIFEQRVGPILKSLGVKLTVHNIAQGANNCSPYQLCYESMGGLDPEFVGWEQSYNCGHDDAIFELAARIAGFSKKKGIVYYSASGAWAPSSCPSSTDSTPYSSPSWTPQAAGLPAWKPSLSDIHAQKSLLDKYAKGQSSSMRFHKFSAGGGFRAVAPMGFNVWEVNPVCQTRDKEDTKDVVGCNGIDAAQGCKLKFMTKEASLYGSDNGKGANWHPTRAFHLLRGEFIAWLYALTIIDAIYLVEDGLKSKSADTLKKELQGALDKLQPPLPPSKRCGANYHCDLRPSCHTDFQPHYSNFTLSKLVVGKTNWTYEPGKEFGYGETMPLSLLSHYLYFYL